jgi:hypothetical protein
MSYFGVDEVRASHREWNDQDEHTLGRPASPKFSFTPAKMLVQMIRPSAIMAMIPVKHNQKDERI